MHSYDNIVSGDDDRGADHQISTSDRNKSKHRYVNVFGADNKGMGDEVNEISTQSISDRLLC